MILILVAGDEPGQLFGDGQADLDVHFSPGIETSDA